jgi:hypothetical protein
MDTSVTARSLLAGLALTAAAVPLHAQRVEAGVAVHSGPVSGHVIVRDRYDEGYSTYRRPVTRHVTVVERPRILVVERVHRRHQARHWTRRGYRPVTVYHWEGRYYDRWIGHRHGIREVVVWERGGRYYHEDYDRDHKHDRDHRHDHDCDDERWEH